mgnify:FL=1
MLLPDHKEFRVNKTQKRKKSAAMIRARVVVEKSIKNIAENSELHF